MTNKTLIKSIKDKLEEVIDPEMYVSIMDLGLVYDVKEKDGKVAVTMTLTSLGCPLFSVIEKDIHDRVSEIDGITNVHVELVFDPPWSMDNMTERGKAILGI